MRVSGRMRGQVRDERAGEESERVKVREWEVRERSEGCEK